MELEDEEPKPKHKRKPGGDSWQFQIGMTDRRLGGQLPSLDQYESYQEADSSQED